jgi:hypothetical protein
MSELVFTVILALPLEAPRPRFAAALRVLKAILMFAVTPEVNVRDLTPRLDPITMSGLEVAELKIRSVVFPAPAGGTGGVKKVG